MILRTRAKHRRRFPRVSYRYLCDEKNKVREELIDNVRFRIKYRT